MTGRKKLTRRVKMPRKPARKKRRKSLTKMTAGELSKATAEFDEEFVVDSFGQPNPQQEAQLGRAKRKRGRPRVGKGVKVISVSVEQGLLDDTDRLARKLKVRRSTLISRGLEAVLHGEVIVDV